MKLKPAQMGELPKRNLTVKVGCLLRAEMNFIVLMNAEGEMLRYLAAGEYVMVLCWDRGRSHVFVLASAGGIGWVQGALLRRLLGAPGRRREGQARGCPFPDGCLPRT